MTTVLPSPTVEGVDATKKWASREDFLAEQENLRRDGVRKRRLHYRGEQYDADNAACMEAIVQEHSGWRQPGEKGVARAVEDRFHLPEQMRRHPYATFIADSVDFIADRLAQGFTVEASPDAVQTIVDDCLAASPALSGGDDEDDQLSVSTVLREAILAGDTCALVRWDNVEQHGWLEFWDSEQVDARFVDDHPDRLERVMVDQMDWRPVPGSSAYPDPEQCTIRREWVLSADPESTVTEADPASGLLTRRCVERVWVIDKGEEAAKRPVEVIEWGSPVLPWWPIRAEHRNLRDTRGVSLITEQAMNHARRYDANEQLSFQIGRTNSHSNIVLTGNVVGTTGQPGGGTGTAGSRPTVVRKDVADALVFPGEVNVTALSLPTDPQMIEHQRKVLLDAGHAAFGLRRSDAEAVSDTGQVSGYALEILNQRENGTFSRVRTLLTRDIKRLLGVVVDCHAAWVSGATTPPDPADDDPLTADPNADLAVDEGDRPTTEVRGDTDPYPERTITVTLGTGWIVDEAKLRDDLTAGALSRRGMWRERGKSKDWIDENEAELDEQSQKSLENAQAQMAATGETGRFGAGSGAQGDEDQAPTGGRNGSSTQQAGRTTNDARSPQNRDQQSRTAVGARGRTER